MTRGWSAALLSVGLCGVGLSAMILMLPFGMAEPGHPHGFGPELFVWAFAELAWSVWAFGRSRFANVKRRSRTLGVAVILGGVALGVVAGFALFDRDEWIAACWALAVPTIVACRFGRFFLQTGFRASASTPVH